jgi:putative membrane protein
MQSKRISIWNRIMFVSLLLIITMSVISSAVSLGDRLGEFGDVFKYIFYGLIVLVICGGIVYPMVRVFFAPVFSLDRLHREDGSARKKWCRLLVRNLLKNTELTEEEKEQVKGFLKMNDETDDKLIEFFDRKIGPEVNRVIYDTAKKVFVVTAVSQNSVYDMLGMASANYTLLKRIIEICGFRPSTPQVIGLYIKVASITLLAGGLEEMDLEDMIPLATESALSKTLGIIAASATQGALNALMTLRIAVIAKNYLLNADVRQTRKELRRKSYSEAAGVLKSILKRNVEEKVTYPVKRVFGGKKRETAE